MRQQFPRFFCQEGEDGPAHAHEGTCQFVKYCLGCDTLGIVFTLTVEAIFEHIQVHGAERDVTEVVQRVRSEEHTSELQSRGHLVCRLLLEKKKKTGHTSPIT